MNEKILLQQLKLAEKSGMSPLFETIEDAVNWLDEIDNIDR
ncbi:MAG: hypothetical protein PHY30_03175 [Candidatus Pacebacteria bacterium]|nr:hypothetical protein [Candidatus Paceibacterota bacterium]